MPFRLATSAAAWRTLAAARTGRRAYRTPSTGVYGHRASDKAVPDFAQLPTPFRAVGVTDDAVRAALLDNWFERYGHLATTTNPLSSTEERNELYGQFEGAIPDAIRDVDTSRLADLKKWYASDISIEFDHLEKASERDFFAGVYQRLFDHVHQTFDEDAAVRAHFAKMMLQCQTYDHFLASRFGHVKRYGAEGAESMLVFFDQLFAAAVARCGVTDSVVCMPHRGRLNFLNIALRFPAYVMFRKMKGLPEFPSAIDNSGQYRFLGDVLSHLFTSVNLDLDEISQRTLLSDSTVFPGVGGASHHVSLIPNPSHLEGNNPVSAGKARARMQSLSVGPYASDVTGGDGPNPVLCVQVHGDASFSAQGVVAETFQISKVPHFDIGGSIHLIVNNQIGYTTEPERGRSSRYCSDLAKMVACPVIHVNGDNPRDVAIAAQTAVAYRAAFGKDIVVDFVCFRKHGHNELDEASFTQPRMYDRVRARKSIPDTFKDTLMQQYGHGEADFDVSSYKSGLETDFERYQKETPPDTAFKGRWKGLEQASPSVITTWDTGVDVTTLKEVGRQSVTLPDTFNTHVTLAKTFVKPRQDMFSQDANETDRVLYWADAEALAIGSLMKVNGAKVRISGQDVGRGTFSQRHWMFTDQKTDEINIPLNDMAGEGRLEVANSALSEEAVIGFEYGFSLECPNNLVLWEAQFGDFFNTAQPMFDTFLLTSESKWLLQTALVVLLPHGMDGAGPEHSSCRPERFLQQTTSSETSIDSDDVNFSMVVPTTPAQYFHLLRRQMVRPFRQPLVVAGPKMLLRHPEAMSSLSELTPGTSFKSVIDDDMVTNAAAVKRVVFTSGKHFYTLRSKLNDEFSGQRGSTAIVRVEELCPFPAMALQAVSKRYSGATDWVWSQEEHRNQGCWTFVEPRFRNIVGVNLRYAGRPSSNQPATGVGMVHQAEIKQMISDTFSK